MAKIYSIIVIVLALGIVPGITHAASLSFSPSVGAINVNEKKTITVMVSTTTSLNAISGDIIIPPDTFTIDSISKSGSILNFWVAEPTFSKSTGVIHFEGVTLGGFSGPGKVLSIVIHPTKIGSGTTSFRSVQILANDGQGTSITGATNPATFTIGPAPEKPIIPETKPTLTQAPEVVEAPVRTPPALLDAPEIMLGAKYGEPAVIGSSHYPKAQVLLTFIDREGSKVFITGDTADDGSFVLLVPRALRDGSYTVTAIAITSNGVHSTASQEIVFKAGGFWGNLDMKIKIIGLVILGLLLMGLGYSLIRGGGRVGVSAIKRVVHKSFELLREDVADHKKVSELKKELNEAEDIITKEIKESR